jgi:hypothetical protein
LCIEQVIGTIPVLESVTTLAYVAAVTKRVRLGVAVLLIAQRNPSRTITIAKATGLSVTPRITRETLIPGFMDSAYRETAALYSLLSLFTLPSHS